MRKAASKLHWQGIGVLVALTVALGILAPLLLYSSARADPLKYNAYARVVDISDFTTGANADIHNQFGVPKDDPEPWPNLMYDIQVSFQPKEWGVAKGEDVDIGALVARLEAQSTLGMIDNPCNTAISPIFQLMNCSLDTSETVNYDGQFVNKDTLADGCTKWPDFLTTLFPGMTPIARMGDYTYLPGTVTPVSMNFLIFEPGTTLPARFNAPSFPAAKGYVAISITNDPTGPLVKDKVTDMCPPLSTDMYYFGLSKDNPRTSGVNEGSHIWRTNPQCPGTYTFWGYTASIRDADADNFDNSLDTCPYDYDPLCDPTDDTYPGDLDQDGLCDICDPDDGTAFNNDPDADAYKNHQDNCPLISNPDQLDTDLDRLGDLCDHNVNTPDGNRLDAWFPTEIEITGEECGTPTPTATATATATAGAGAGTATATVGAGSPTAATPTPTPTVVAGDTCVPVFPGLFNGRVLIDGKPATDGYQLTASIGDLEWGSDIIAGGRYAMDIPDHMPTLKPCFESGTITFALNGMTCTPVEKDADKWGAGIRNVDLNCAPVAPPVTPAPTTPPPAATATTPSTPKATQPPAATPTKIPTVPPFTGAGGLSGSSSGLPLWAMALAGWAGLMTVAGLGTLMAAKRR